MPKKPQGGEVKPTSETASFRKVVSGFAPDEVNLYISSLRKKNLELQAENDRLLEAHSPEKELKIENLEKRLSEADERYFKQKDVCKMLETECGRFVGEIEGLHEQLDAVHAQLEAAKKASGGDVSDEVINEVRAAAQKEIQSLNSQLIASKTATDEVKAELEEAKNELSKAHENANNELSGIKSELKAAKKEAAEAVSQIGIIKADFEIAENKSKLAVSKLKEERAALENTKAELERAGGEFARVSSENERMRADLERAKSAIEAAKSKKKEEPVFVEADTVTADQLTAALEEIDNLRLQLTDAKAETAELNDGMSKAELKIKILQEESENSYIIPEKYLQMVAEAEEDEDEDDFSYLLADAPSPVPKPVVQPRQVQQPPRPPQAPRPPQPPKQQQAPRAQVPPPRPPTRGQESLPPPPEYEQYTRQNVVINQATAKTAPASPIKMAPKAASRTQQTSAGIPLIKPNPSQYDPNFETSLVRDFDEGTGFKGKDLKPNNPHKKEARGENLIPGNPHAKPERGADLNEELFEMVIGDASHIGENVDGYMEDRPVFVENALADYEFDFTANDEDDDDMSTGADFLGQII